MFYSLDAELEEYIRNAKELSNTAVINQIQDKFLKNDKKRALDSQIDQQLMEGGLRTL